MFKNCHSIVVRDNPASEYYFSYCAPSWRQVGIELSRFDAVTPADLINRSEITFGDYYQSTKYRFNNIKAPITDTEKACWYSHYDLWVKCAEANEPFFITEHDSYLERPELFWYQKNRGVIFYDKAATGSYVMQPEFARFMLHFCKHNRIDVGPYSVISYIRSSNKNTTGKDIVNAKHKDFVACSNQVMSLKYGNTIEHYSDTIKNQYNFQEHEFKVIP